MAGGSRVDARGPADAEWVGWGSRMTGELTRRGGNVKVSATPPRRGGRVVECAGFENRSARKGSGSSNLPLSAYKVLTLASREG